MSWVADLGAFAAVFNTQTGLVLLSTQLFLCHLWNTRWFGNGIILAYYANIFCSTLSRISTTETQMPILYTWLYQKKPNPWYRSLRDGVTHRHWPSRQGIEFILVQLKDKIHQNLGNRLGWKPSLDKQQAMYPISTSQPEYQWSSMSSHSARLNQKVGWRLGTKPTWGKVIQLWASTSHGAECIFANHKIHKHLCRYRTDH